MPKTRSRLMAALALVCAPLVAQADMPVTYMQGDRALFHFDAPDFWTVRAGGPRELTAPGDAGPRAVVRVIGLQPTAEDKVWMGFVAPLGVSTFADAAEYLRDIGPHLVKDVTVSATQERRIGGRPARTLSGTGRRNGQSVTFTAVAIDLPRDRMAIAVTVFQAGSDPALIDDVNRVYDSFRAAQ